MTEKWCQHILVHIFYLGIYSSFQIRLIIGNSLNSQSPFILSDKETSNKYSLCNNEPHTISIEITSADARLKVDNTRVQVETFQIGFTPVTITGFFSIGGIPREYLIDSINFQLTM